MSAWFAAISTGSAAVVICRSTPAIATSGCPPGSLGSAGSICASADLAASRMSPGVTGAAGGCGARVAARIEFASAMIASFCA